MKLLFKLSSSSPRYYSTIKLLSPPSPSLSPVLKLRQILYYSTTPNGCHDNHTYPLPWPHHTTRLGPPDPLFHKMAGLFLLKRIIKASGYKFTTSEFLQGVKEAILSFSRLLFSSNSNVLNDLLHPNLYQSISTSLSSSLGSLQPQLHVESIRNLSLISARSIVGVAPPEDRHVISYLGQKMITSQSKMETLMYSNGRITIHSAKEIGEQASAAKMEFLLTVAFNSKERYIVFDEGGAVVDGSDKVRSSTHQWTFGSQVNWESEYPLEWRIYNINNYLLSEEKEDDNEDT